MAEEIQLVKRRWIKGGEIGAGGFGRVFEAKGERGEIAVLKFVKKERGGAREQLVAKNVSGLRGVMPIWDFGETDDSWVLAMPRADDSLDHYLQASGGRLELKEALRPLRDVAAGLAALAEEIVHRDLKPSNILLYDGAWRIADFGSARYADATTHPHSTRRRVFTPPYAAPEQIREERATQATDVYALGCITYELLTGHPPFAGSVDEILEQHRNVRPQTINGLPYRIENLIMRCLLKTSAARPRIGEIVATFASPTPKDDRLSSILANIESGITSRQMAHDAAAIYARNQAEQREQLTDEAISEFKAICNTFADRIATDLRQNMVQRSDEGGFFVQADRGLFSIANVQRNEAFSDQMPQMPLEVLAYSRVRVQTHTIAPDELGSQSVTASRTHALWYCDPFKEGDFGWYELAYLPNGSIPDVRYGELPTDLRPWGEAAASLRKDPSAKYILAMPFSRLNSIGWEKFLERWIGWLENALNGALPLMRTPGPRSYDNVRWKLY